ncbi:hypothetical protein ACO0K9_03455 [Undibacterium sp. Ji50W]|uniref:hypothetical protein n=1 Tax=Undibacterium sp. Ji50W TaxID=3413041 RepID=UPI003BF34DD4
MPIELPDLDDRRFADLVDEGRAMIPGLAPSWTDHNLSDPGITLIELFASVSEQLIYRVNRVTTEHKKAFLKLLAPGQEPGEHIDDDLAKAICGLRVEKRAITASDFEQLAGTVNGVQHARCLPRTKLVKKDNVESLEHNAIGHVTLVLVGNATMSPDKHETMLVNTRKKLQGCTALTISSDETLAAIPEGNRATLHVMVARPLQVTINVELVCFAEHRSDQGKQVGLALTQALQNHFHCVAGEEGYRPPPPGKALYKSELYAVITRVTGVDYVKKLTLTVDGQPDSIGIIPGPDAYIKLAVRWALSNE